jgi:hypothetical protein
LIFTVIIIAFVHYLKREYEDLSTGNIYTKPHHGSHAQKISNEEFEKQKKDYTDKEVDKLLKSPLYAKKRA